jgi:GT2 family glycosyltransferase
MFASLVLVLALTYVLLPRLGIDAVGLAWLISQSGVAAAAVLTRHRLRGEVGFPPTPGFRRRQTSADVRGSQMSELVAATDGRPAPSTSVVVCAFTERRWADLRAALESVRGQTMPPGEVVLVIDHDERLLARVQGLAGVRAVGNRGPQGLSGARNTGVCESRGDIVFFLDDDAAAGAEWIRRSLEQFRDPAVVGVGAWVNPRWDPPGRPNWFPEEFLWVVGCSYGGLPTTTSDIRNPIGAAMAFRRSAFEVVGGFRTDVGRVGAMPSGCEETEFAIRVRQRDPRTRVVLEPSACVSHRVPVERQSLRYFVRRCWHEGRSKRVVTRTVGSADGLAAERGQLARVLPAAVLSGLAGALRTGRLSGVLRAAAVLVGAAATAGGYAVPVAPVTRRAPRSSVPPDRLRR